MVGVIAVTGSSAGRRPSRRQPEPSPSCRCRLPDPECRRFCRGASRRPSIVRLRLPRGGPAQVPRSVGTRGKPGRLRTTVHPIASGDQDEDGRRECRLACLRRHTTHPASNGMPISRRRCRRRQH